MTRVQNPLEVLVIGAGAVGTLFATSISRRPNVRLTVLCRSNYESVRHQGLELRAKRHTDSITIRPHRVASSLSTLSSIPFSYVVCANKTTSEHSPLDAGDLERIGRSKETSFVAAQNGVLNERLLQKAFPHNPILSAICYASVTRASPTVVVENLRMHRQTFKVGPFTRCKASVDAAQQLAAAGGEEFSFIDGVDTERWKKMILNASFNTTAALFSANTHEIIEDAYKRAIAQELGRETYEVARVMGVKLEANTVQKIFDAVGSVPPFAPSMLQDRLTGHPLEIDIICGQVAHLGQAKGVNVSHLQAVSRELDKINQEMSGQRHGGWQYCSLTAKDARPARPLSASL